MEVWWGWKRFSKLVSNHLLYDVFKVPKPSGDVIDSPETKNENIEYAGDFYKLDHFYLLEKKLDWIFSLPYFQWKSSMIVQTFNGG